MLQKKGKFFYFLTGFFILVLFFTRFFNLSFPSKIVFDETHEALYASKYLSHQYYFATHPPFGRLLFGLIAFLVDNQERDSFSQGSNYKNFNYLPLRALTALFGCSLIIILYFLVKELGFSKRSAFLASFLVLFDNAVLVQSRLILTDIILIFFIFLSLYFYLLSRKFLLFSPKWYLFHFLTSLSLTFAISTKWDGLGALATVWFSTIFFDKLFFKSKKEIFLKFFFFFFFPFLIYFFIFTIHLKLAYLPCYSNCGAVLDLFLNKEKVEFFNVPPPTKNLFEQFFIQNKLIFFTLLAGTDFPYQGPWWTWPFMIFKIPYFYEEVKGKISIIYFWGNPFVWGFAFTGILALFYLTIKSFFKKDNNFFFQIPSPGFYLLIFGYFIHFLPFATVGRLVPIYHYLTSLIFSIILFSIFYDWFLKRFHNPKISQFFFFSFLFLIFFGFLIISPLSYGLPIEEKKWEIYSRILKAI